MCAIPLSILAGMGHLLIGNVDFMLLGNLLLGSIPVVIIGLMLSSRLPQEFLHLLLVIVLLTIRLKLWRCV